MNQAICEREHQTAAAIRTGDITPEIAAHARQCAVCSEVLLVSAFLHTKALSDQERADIPDPARIWQEAQRQATQQAIHQALRPIRFMKLIACIAFACSPLFRWLLPIGRELAASWWKAFDLNLTVASTPWAPTTETTLLLGLSGTIVLLALSSWYMLREG